MSATRKLTREEQAAFDRARYQYCLQIFNREEERREILERKAQFYLSLVALFLGAVFFKPEFLDFLGDFLTSLRISIIFRLILMSSLIALAISLFVTLVAILKSMWLESYKGEFPGNLFDSLFDPESPFIDVKNESGFYQATAMALSIAMEHNVAVNNTKSRWVTLAAYSIVAGVFSLTILLGVFTILSITT